MPRIRERRDSLTEHMKMQEHLASRSRKILRGQADRLCRALQKLKSRSDAGQATANRIWDSLIDGITAEIPTEFFYDHANNYFWDSSEELSADEMAFRKLLEEAASKKQEICEEKIRDGNAIPPNNNKLFAISVEVPVAKSTEHSESSSSSSLTVKPCQTGLVDDQESSDEEADRLLQHLIDMLRVAAERTDLHRWEWKEEDEELKQEMEGFNRSLKVAMTLFTEIHNSSDLTTLIEAIEKFSADDAAEMLRMLNDTSPCSGDSSSYDYTDDEEEGEGSDENEDFDSSATEVDSDQETKAIDLTKKKNDISDKKEESLKPTGPTSPSGFVDASNQKLDPADGEGYIIRHARSKKAGKPLKSKMFRNSGCDHTGYIIPTSHYRDWKRDGFRCMCGQKFRFLNAMDKHIFTQQEARVLNCDKCEYKVNRKCCMDKHKKDYHDKPKMLRACRRLYQCMFGCEGVLKSKRELLDHQKKTERQCKHMNALKLPARQLPPTPIAFLDILRETCERSSITLTVDRFYSILSATEKDADRLKRFQGANGIVEPPLRASMFAK